MNNIDITKLKEILAYVTENEEEMIQHQIELEEFKHTIGLCVTELKDMGMPMVLRPHDMKMIDYADANPLLIISAYVDAKVRKGIQNAKNAHLDGRAWR